VSAKPLFVINFKAYENSFGDAGLAVAKQIEEAARIKGVHVILCVPATDIARVASAVQLPVYAQHVDAIEPGQHTGWLAPKMILAAGAKGTLLNHSEHRLREDVEKAVLLAKNQGLSVIVCAQDATEVKILRNLPADFIAVEPPELIGGDVSVSSARPELIAQSVKHSPDRLLVGAGVKTRDDVARSVELGARGVLVASGVVKAANVKETCLALFSGW
jgi:triosephosphate isomerase